MTVQTTHIRRYQHFIDGRWIDSTSETTIPRRSPAMGGMVAEFAAGTREDALLAISAARKAFDNGPWPRMSGIERGRVLSSLARLMRREQEHLARIDAEEVGKPIRQSRNDLAEAITLIEYAGGLAQQLHGETYTNLGKKYIAMVAREPVGVVALIVPWNFPALIYAQKLSFALATGCTVVGKPSEYTSGSALEICRLAEEAGIPPGVVNVVTGLGNPVGQTLVESQEVDLLSFTGSTATGQRILAGTKSNVKPLSLELGGKAATIVFADADLADALEGTLFGMYLNQGECCVSATRLLLQDTIADEFLRRLVERSCQLRVGNPLDEQTDIGALIHQGHLHKVLEYIDIGKQQGACLLTGGERLTGSAYEQGYFVNPTIFDHVLAEMRIFQEEIFGPVLCVSRFHTRDEAITLANNTAYGLANTIWTRDLETAMIVSRALRSGTVWVNTMIDGLPQLPFGGYKASGYGRERGNAGLEAFTQIKTIQFHLGKYAPFFENQIDQGDTEMSG
jgi:acyl-CoA reductase-like NAD-dependent aldehyde dehydrogenase